MSAQGNALGIRCRLIEKPQRGDPNSNARNSVVPPRWGFPYLRFPKPRALPWADIELARWAVRPDSHDRFKPPELSRAKHFHQTRFEVRGAYDRGELCLHYHLLFRSNLVNSTHELVELHPMRHFSHPEIELLAIHAGFKLLHSEEFLTAKPASKESWGVCFVLQKIQD